LFPQRGPHKASFNLLWQNEDRERIKRKKSMSIFLPISCIVAVLLTTDFAQAQTPNVANMTPQEAARINEAVRQADPQTRTQFGTVEKALQDAGHPSAKLLEMTRPKTP
jgi:hypothetical protein